MVKGHRYSTHCHQGIRNESETPYTSSGMAQTQNRDNAECLWAHAPKAALSHWWECKMPEPLWMEGGFLEKDYFYHKTCQGAPWYFLNRAETHIHILTKTCTKVLRAVLFITVKTCTQQVNGVINRGTSRHGILVSTEKKWAIKPQKGMERP